MLKTCVVKAMSIISAASCLALRSWMKFSFLSVSCTKIQCCLFVCHLSSPSNASSELLQSPAWSVTQAYRSYDRASAKNRRKASLWSYSSFKHTNKLFINKLIRNLPAHQGNFPPEFNKNMQCSSDFYILYFNLGWVFFPFNGWNPSYNLKTEVAVQIWRVLEAQYINFLLKVFWTIWRNVGGTLRKKE